MMISELYQFFKESRGVVTDTRKELKDKMFFALKGENFNGNEYAVKAIKNGASLAVVDDEEYQLSEQCILVPDVLNTLQALASFHRKVLGLPIIGITGTNGKTTNKELLGHILSQKFKCFYTRGNLNNHIGVPLSLLEIEKSHEIAIIEMGANRMGDIVELCEIADPDYGYITNIGIAHLEGFKTKENIIIEKGKLFNYVKKKKGVFFVNTSEKEVFNIAKDYPHSVLIGEKEMDFYIFKLHSCIPSIKFSDSLGEKYESPLYGKHNYENLKMACAMGQYFNVPIQDIKSALKNYSPQNNRSQVIEKNGSFIFLDAYNANPSSMKSSLLSFSKFESNRKVLVLGDMLEMGDHSSTCHNDILMLVNKSVWKDVVLIGEKFSEFSERYLDFHFFKDVQTADGLIQDLLLPGTYFLLKGSRGIALEKLKIIQL